MVIAVFCEIGRFPIANEMLWNIIKYFQRLLSEHTNLLTCALTESCCLYKNKKKDGCLVFICF